MKSLLPVLIVLFSLLGQTSCNASAEGLVLNIKLSRSVIAPLEPLGIVTDVVNGTQVPLSIDGLFIPPVQVQERQEKGYKTLTGIGGALPYALKNYVGWPKNEVIAPGQHLKSVQWIVFPENETIGTRTKKYQLYYSCGAISSAILEVKVKKLAGKELEAAQYLQKHDLSRYLEENLQWTHLSDLLPRKEPEALEKFITTYPDTSYAVSTKISLLALRAVMDRKEFDLRQDLQAHEIKPELRSAILDAHRRLYGSTATERLINADYPQELSDIEKELGLLALTLTDSWKARAWIEAGNVAYLRNNYDSMYDDLGKAVSTTRDVAIKTEVELKRNYLYEATGRR